MKEKEVKYLEMFQYPKAGAERRGKAGERNGSSFLGLEANKFPLSTEPVAITALRISGFIFEITL